VFWDAHHLEIPLVQSWQSTISTSSGPISVQVEQTRYLASPSAEESGGERRRAMIEYKGYTGVVEFDPELSLFAGHMIDLRDEIHFEGGVRRGTHGVDAAGGGPLPPRLRSSERGTRAPILREAESPPRSGSSSRGSGRCRCRRGESQRLAHEGGRVCGGTDGCSRARSGGLTSRTREAPRQPFDAPCSSFRLMLSIEAN